MKLVRSLWLLIGAIGIVIASLDARVEVAETMYDFDNIIADGMVIVHFNPFVEDSDEALDLDATKDAFNSLSKKVRYRNAGLLFVGVNIPELFPGDQDDQEEADFRKQFGLSATTSSFALFRNGKQLDGGVKTGELDEKSIESFIEQYFAKRIDHILNRQQKEAEEFPVTTQRTVRYVAQPTYYSYPYYGGYYGRRGWGGYYGPRFGGYYGRGWGRPGFGIGIGFGRGWGW
jgi:hypothetical protein